MNKFFLFKEELKTIAGVLEVSGKSVVPSKGSTTFCFNLQDRTEEYCAFIYMTDVDFVKAHDYRIIAGRDYNHNVASDTSHTFIANRAAVAEMGFHHPENALEKEITLIILKAR